VNAADPHGQTALMWAAANGRTDNIAVLVKHKANVNAVTDKGFTALFFALKSKEATASDALVAAGADSKAKLPDGTTIIEAALVEDNIPFATRQVKNGADVAQRDSHGRQLIHIAAVSGNADLVRLVLAKGGNPNAMTTPPPPEPPKKRFTGAGAKLAVADGSVAPPKPREFATPPLILAAQSGSLDAMKALVEAGAKPDGKAADGTTLALAAAHSGSLAAMKYALELDPHLDAKADGDKSIMHIAVANWTNLEDREQMILFLADKGAVLNAPDARKQTPADNLNRGQAPQELRQFYVQLLKDRNVAASTNH
jgi:ankyrin repeat protein